ncbi:MAG TPA: hypothetical protein VLA56_11420 [Pseudomonadales bacterium]|nr:hypothetical protein [Pseudomonadales bacterium]
MRMSFRLSCLLAAALLVTACGPSVDGYVRDGEARRAMLGQCASLKVDPTEDERCAMAAEAETIAAREALSKAFD